LQEKIREVQFNGDYNNSSLYTLLNVSFPKNEVTRSLLSILDINNIFASGGSACNSSSIQGSHVLKAIGRDHNTVSIRFSFSRYNTLSEIDRVVHKLETLVNDRE
jgi:cysteine desulfurase